MYSITSDISGSVVLSHEIHTAAEIVMEIFEIQDLYIKILSMLISFGFGFRSFLLISKRIRMNIR